MNPFTAVKNLSQFHLTSLFLKVLVLYCIVCGTKLLQNARVLGNVALWVCLPEFCPSALPLVMEQEGLAIIFTAR
jgi:hypothetical protein